MMRFDLVDLGLFRHVVEAGSITHGAVRANLALAAASARIRAMEVSLGAALLTRGRQGVTTTPAGRALLAHARDLLDGIDRMQGELAAFSGGTVGQIRVLSNTNALTEFLPEVLSAFLARQTGVSVDIEERTSDEIVGLGIVPQTTAARAARTMAIAVVPLRDSWAVRDLTICVRTLAALPAFAQDFVAHLRTPPPGA